MLSCGHNQPPLPMPHNTFKRTEREEFLDNYFSEQLQKIISRINTPEPGSRTDRQNNILDHLLSLADEYQAVMIEGEQGYWYSIETWKDEYQQRLALTWVNNALNKEIE